MLEFYPLEINKIVLFVKLFLFRIFPSDVEVFFKGNSTVKLSDDHKIRSFQSDLIFHLLRLHVTLENLHTFSQFALFTYSLI